MVRPPATAACNNELLGDGIEPERIFDVRRYPDERAAAAAAARRAVNPSLRPSCLADSYGNASVLFQLVDCRGHGALATGLTVAAHAPLSAVCGEAVEAGHFNGEYLRTLHHLGKEGGEGGEKEDWFWSVGKLLAIIKRSREVALAACVYVYAYA